MAPRRLELPFGARRWPDGSDRGGLELGFPPAAATGAAECTALQVGASSRFRWRVQAAGQPSTFHAVHPPLHGTEGRRRDRSLCPEVSRRLQRATARGVLSVATARAGGQAAARRHRAESARVDLAESGIDCPPPTGRRSVILRVHVGRLLVTIPRAGHSLGTGWRMAAAGQ